MVYTEMPYSPGQFTGRRKSGATYAARWPHAGDDPYANSLTPGRLRTSQPTHPKEEVMHLQEPSTAEIIQRVAWMEFQARKAQGANPESAARSADGIDAILAEHPALSGTQPSWSRATG